MNMKLIRFGKAVTYQIKQFLNKTIKIPKPRLTNLLLPKQPIPKQNNYKTSLKLVENYKEFQRPEKYVLVFVSSMTSVLFIQGSFRVDPYHISCVIT